MLKPIIWWLIIIVALTLNIYQWFSFSNSRLMLENALSASEKQRNILQSDLNTVQRKVDEKEKVIKVLFQEKERYLSELYKEKQRAYVEAENLRAKISSLEGLGSQATNQSNQQDENWRLRKEVAGLKEELRLWEGKIKSLQEKQLVLQKMVITKKTLAQRVKAIRGGFNKIMCYTPLLAGNSGYLVKDGKPTLGRNNAVELEKIVVEKKQD